MAESDALTRQASTANVSAAKTDDATRTAIRSIGTPESPMPFAEYGKLGFLAHDFINFRISRHPHPTWNVQGSDLRITELKPDGTLHFEAPAGGEAATVTLDGAGFDKLIRLLVF